MAKHCSNLVELSSVVTGMADELPGSFGKTFHKHEERFEVESASVENAHRSVWSAQPRVVEVTIRFDDASAMARLMPRVIPKSSALTMRLRTESV